MNEDKNMAIVCLWNIHKLCLTYSDDLSIQHRLVLFHFTPDVIQNLPHQILLVSLFLGRRCILCADGGQGDRNMANITSLAMPHWPAARRRMSSHPNCQQKSISAMDLPLFLLQGAIFFFHEQCISVYIYFSLWLFVLGAKYVGVRVWLTNAPSKIFSAITLVWLDKSLGGLTNAHVVNAGADDCMDDSFGTDSNVSL